VDVPPERFASVAREKAVSLVGLSGLLTTTLVNMRSTIVAFGDLGFRDRVKVRIGGAPVADAFAKEIGADGCASDAMRAVALPRSLAKQEVGPR
jgi:5-methyltetrahydrofolate--homocysteine methyltransferase